MRPSIINDESGATSVLVIFMMLVLVTLGAYSISSAHANYAFSSRSLEWKEAYYDCDAKAEVFLMDADTALARAERGTAEAVMGRDAGDLDGNIGQSIDIIFHQNVLKEIAFLSDKYNVEVDEGNLDISTVISSSGGSQIKVRITALPFRYSIAPSNGGVNGILNGNRKRYAILEWKETQKTGGNNAVQEPLWDGKIH